MTEAFLRCLPITLRNEGVGLPNNPTGYVWDEDDPGGETNWGISRKFCEDVGLVNEDIANMTEERATQLYWQYFWHPSHSEEVFNTDPLLGMQFFDMCVNAGVHNSVKCLQRCCGAYVDGHIGAQTLQLLSNVNADSFMEERKNYYYNITIHRPKSKKYLDGWIARVNNTSERFLNNG